MLLAGYFLSLGMTIECYFGRMLVESQVLFWIVLQTDISELLRQFLTGNANNLVAAASSGDIDTVKLLLQKRANPNARNDAAATALQAAAAQWRLSICKVLIDAGAAVDNNFNPGDQSPKMFGLENHVCFATHTCTLDRHL